MVSATMTSPGWKLGSVSASAEHGFVAVASGGDDVIGEAFAAELVSGGRSVFGEQVGERDSGVGLVGLGVDVVEGDGFLRERLQVVCGECGHLTVEGDLQGGNRGNSALSRTACSCPGSGRW